MIHPMTWGEQAAGTAMLIIEGGRNNHNVRQLNLPGTGLVLYYGAPKSKPGPTNPERLVSEIIPVKTAAGAE